MLLLRLCFAETITETIRRRISYAFRVFCAVYGYTPTEASDVPTLCYGLKPAAPLEVALHNNYQERRPHERRPPQFVVVNQTQFPCFHPKTGSGPDWLGEIFEWLSGDYERSVETVDSVGRIPFEAGLHGSFSLDPLVPFCAVAMAELNAEIRRVAGNQWPALPLAPWPNQTGCTIAATHDVDALPVSRAAKLQRSLKDGVIATFIERKPEGIRSALRLAATAMHAEASENIAPVLRLEHSKNIRSTFNFICRDSHRRDADYTITNPKVIQLMRRIAEEGHEIGVHGSYTSLESAGRLAEEYRVLRGLGFPAMGGRQHWLRYRTQEPLFNELQAAGAIYDTSLGYSCRPGFRNGACFPFPPYDFTRESAYPLLEMPLVIMDVTLHNADASKNALPLSRSVLQTTRRWGWGGVSILWHDTTFGRYPKLGNIYSDLKEDCDSWIPAAELARRVWTRYETAALVPSWPVSETPAALNEKVAAG